jgi:hypothetical protein
MEKINCEICKSDEKFLLERHHINSKSLDGPDTDWNLVDLCVRCHRLVHNGLIVIEGWFGSTQGRVLLWRKFDKESISGLPDPKIWLYKNAKIYELNKTS